MSNSNKNTCKSLLLLGIVIGSAIASPMFYKKKENDKYEPDLIPISSTVIPLEVYQVNATLDASKYHSLPLSEEYKIAYMKHIHKKDGDEDEDPDTLITIKKKYHHEKPKLKIRKDEDATVILASVGADVKVSI